MQNSGEERGGFSGARVRTFQELRDLLPNIMREIESESLDSNTIDALHFTLDWLQGLITCLLDVYGIAEQIVNLIRGARDRLAACLPVTAFMGQHGRPKYLIPRDQLEFLIGRRVTVVEIASLLGVSVRTIEQRLSDYGLNVRSTYSCINNVKLDEMILNILTEFPNTGYRRLAGFLLSRGLRIQHWRIREAMQRVNRAGVLLRALVLRAVHRSRYQVYGPLALWHIDGNHKLIRYLAH